MSTNKSEAIHEFLSRNHESPRRELPPGRVIFNYDELPRQASSIFPLESTSTVQQDSSQSAGSNSLTQIRNALRLLEQYVSILDSVVSNHAHNSDLTGNESQPDEDIMDLAAIR